MTTAQTEMTWHKDGHYFGLQLNRGDVVITHVHCPGNEDRKCELGRFECIVKFFLETYGLDCNVGICDCAHEIEIAWTAVGDFTDSEDCQVWVMPVNDEAFAAWLISQS